MNLFKQRQVRSNSRDRGAFRECRKVSKVTSSVVFFKVSQMRNFTYSTFGCPVSLPHFFTPLGNTIIWHLLRSPTDGNEFLENCLNA